MEVIDSHMSEHFPAAPTHIDVDMSAEYDDDAEYAMHDVTEATTTNHDEEIYDAEFEEVPEHTEIEMDEYADEVEVIEDNETHMGTYVPTDDGATVTDVTVEDVQLLSSPAPAGIPQVATMHPISPHVSVDTNLPLNEAPVEIADHSPRSVATLVGDSEVEPLSIDAAKDGGLNEVIDLTENDDEPHVAPVDATEEATLVNPVEPTDQALPQTEHEATQDELDEAEREFYEAEEPPLTDPTAPDQLDEPQEDEQRSAHTNQNEPAVDAPTSLEIPQQTDQEGHSPIEEALVINQQVRDDAADSMEPSPPIRLYYRDESKGTNETFDIFTLIGSEPTEAVLLFHDNRTLFYEPLSAFFAKLRETEYFSGDGWESAEIEIRMLLGDSSISINEDHKETESISLFKLSSIWSGLGLEGPLELTLVRRSERFAVQLARLVEQVEQRDFHHEDATEPPEVQPGVETGGPEINSGDVDEDSGPLENNQESSHRALTNFDETSGDLPRGTHEDEDTQAPSAAQPERLDGLRQETDEIDQIKTTPGIGPDKTLEETTQDNATSNQEPTAQPTDDDYQGTEVEGTSLGAQDDDDNTVSNVQSPGTPKPKPREQEYDEYEAEEANDPAPAQATVQNEESSAAWDAEEYDYEEDYQDADEEHDERVPPENAPEEPTDSDRALPTQSASKLIGHESLQNVTLKRNLDELEYEEYETPSAPSSPSSDHKRVKHT
ncbi:Mediator of RNA polymerase II transcription subunit 12 [Rhizoctonia solani]|uniref:Mediator of RNA polymerase II transcription subunit 12 n=1 Tax=Rhizoctonia solani TaxID=456999 RepID=A0A0K6GBI0_9AGAM|nr:Mediator of RNA polymerase II transcription subunit 12 [Rhizoctonia solani]